MILNGLNIRAFCVTLQELPEKQEFIDAHFKERGFECEYFNGFSAKESGLRTVHNYELDNPGGGWNIGDKPVATWLSFYSLWSAMLYMDSDYFATVEWDCQLPVDWKVRTEQALRDVPKDFDLLLIGSCCCSDKPKTHIKGDVWHVKNPLCGHFTIVAKKALPILLKTQRKVYAPLDISLSLHSFQFLKVATVLPSIATQFGTELQP